MSGTVYQAFEFGEPEPAAPARSNEAIAKELWVSRQTVKFHVRNVYRKLGVSNRTEAARYAYHHGAVENAVDDLTAIG